MSVLVKVIYEDRGDGEISCIVCDVDAKEIYNRAAYGEGFGETLEEARENLDIFLDNIGYEIKKENGQLLLEGE